jgi:hypothetical protein
MLTVIWHLLFNNELFVEEGFSKTSVRVKSMHDSDVGSGSGKVLSLDDVAGVLCCAVRVVSDGG